MLSALRISAAVVMKFAAVTGWLPTKNWVLGVSTRLIGVHLSHVLNDTSPTAARGQARVRELELERALDEHERALRVRLKRGERGNENESGAKHDRPPYRCGYGPPGPA